MSEGITQIQQPTPEQLKPRERLPDEEMGNLVSSVGNNEAKAITLILMRNGNVYDKKGLHKEILNAQGKNKTWDIGHSATFDYCSETFSPIGLVAKEALDFDLSVYGYAITDKGKELGIPLAGLLLDFSQRHNVPLVLLLGATQSPSKKKIAQTEKGKSTDIEFKKRAPSTTLKIFYELITSPDLPIGEEELGRRIGEGNPSAVLEHLRRLAQLGVVQYEATGANEPYSCYKLSSEIPEEELPVYGESPILTQAVFDILLRYSKEYPDQFLTREDAYNLLPQERKDKWGKNNLKNALSQTLSLLNEHGFAVVEKFHLGKQSEINITDEQRIMLTEFLEIMYRFQNRDPEILEKGKMLAEGIITNPQEIASLMKRAKEASRQANTSPSEETQARILSIISAHPGITNKEIQILLRQNYGKELGIVSARELSHLLIGKGDTRVEKVGSVSKFYPSF